MKTPRRAAVALSALALAGALSACSSDEGTVPITNDPATPQDGDPVAPDTAPEPVVPSPAG